ncbi:MAG: DUF1045 domain-containing protein [Azospirillum sp.]|nr:DUF1045 domain-containing protein [Azospirillum sp.]
MRFAIYYAPERDDPLWMAGCDWLGRDPESGEVQPPPSEAAGLVDDAARYGFHATLKAPFALADSVLPDELEAAMEGFAARRRVETMPVLAVRRLDGFLALRPERDGGALGALADSCVRDFDRFRRPPTLADLAKRRAAGLTPSQDAHLARWGYPHVFDAFRFHMTLTKRLDDVAASALEVSLTRRFAAALAVPRALRSLALFVEPVPGAPFTLRRRFPFESR